MSNANTTGSLARWDDPSQTPLIEFHNVTKRFGEFTAIDNLSLKIYEQEFFALLGPSGCGKTTLMRMLAGFEQPTEGRITLDGKDLVAVPPNKRPVNMMFQSYALCPNLTVANNMAFGLKRSDMPPSEIGARVNEMLALVQLSKFGARKPHQISGGQRQRVALARALAKSPKLLLLDEPLAALDKKLREETQFELMDIQEKLGTTFVIVTHDQEEAMTVASRVAVMDHGKLEQVSTPEQIYEFPNSRYVADFIGDVNLIEGTIKSHKSGMCQVSWAEDFAPLLIAHVAALKNGTNCTFAIRPEKVEVAMEKPRDAINAVQGRVLDIAYHGNLSTYHVELSNGQMIKAQVTNKERTGRRAFTWEDSIWVFWTAAAGVILTA